MSTPIFVAEEVLCTYPISTLYDSCPRYLFYALLLATCVTRWTGWLSDVFLGAAATYAGTAALEAFILVGSPAQKAPSSPVTLPEISPNNSTTLSALRSSFPALITNTSELYVTPATIDLDADAVLAIVVTAYLIFLPLQTWSRAFTHSRARYILFSLWHILMLAGTISALIYWPRVRNTPTQYAFCAPDFFPPEDTVSSDGWPSWQRTTPSWNASVWTLFTNATLFNSLPTVCYYPCFNTTQPLRQQTDLEATVADNAAYHRARHAFWSRVLYSTRYIYSLIALTLVVNVILLLFKLLPYRSRIPSSRLWIIWRERREILRGFRVDWYAAVYAAAPHRSSNRSSSSSSSSNTSPHRATTTTTITDNPTDRNTSIVEKTRTTLSTAGENPRSITWLIHLHSLGSLMRLLLDVCILFAVVFSIIISPLTVLAFVAWIEYYIYEDGPAQETPKQVGQWAPLASIGFLVVSAAILKLKEVVAPRREIEWEIGEVRRRLKRLEEMIV
ncbi:uncharacterized protein BP01DRAFT_359409 [Aspergillus saccharolyticus JOP 1030-1]|uniref:Integral membrane protein n=1 Tax=Aspergillus saccharolyticus JOP 1030-1 TaxID=1450539 RepID=A0A318Z5Y7_9EURO|nr:integral membrane protein [Aspergillus saccharolyticus JOP 1030-1]PYH42529.1 integral membrane protein [Aspergillus saccharolyticus JOP 1030-1]